MFYANIRKSFGKNLAEAIFLSKKLICATVWQYLTIDLHIED